MNSSSKNVDTDTFSLLKRVENLRKWQEEEQLKLQRAHEQQLQNLKLEQERIARLVFQQNQVAAMPPLPLNNQPLSLNYQNQASNDEEEEYDDNDNHYDENDEEYDHVEDFISAKTVNDLNLAEADDRLSTILEASCEEATPLKTGHQSRSPKKLPNKRQLQWENTATASNNHHEEAEEIEDENFDENDKEMDDEPQETTLQNNFDEVPVSGKGKSFNDLLKEKLKEDLVVPTKSQPIARVVNKVEIDMGDSEKENQGKNAPRKFLKRGEGLRRYQPRTKSTDERSKSANGSASPKRNRSSSSNMGSTNEKRLSLNSKKEPEKAKAKPQSVSKATTSVSTAQKGQNLNATAVKKTQNAAVKPAQPLTNSQKTIAATKPAAKMVITQKPAEISKKNDEVNQVSELKASNLNINAQKSAFSNERKDVNDDDDDLELKEFEALEQYAEDHASFRSSTSYVETLLTKHHQAQNGFGYKQVHYNAHLSDLVEEANDYSENFNFNGGKMSSFNNNNNNMGKGNNNNMRQLYHDSDDDDDVNNYQDDDVEIYIKKKEMNDYLDSTLTGHLNSSPIPMSKLTTANGDLAKNENFNNTNSNNNVNKVMQRKVTKINYEYVMSSENSDNDDFDLKRNFNMNNIRKRLGSDDFMQSSTESLKEKFQAPVVNSAAAAKPVYNCDSYKSESQCDVESMKKQVSNEFEDDNTWLDESVVKMKRTISASAVNNNAAESVEQMKHAGGETVAPISQLMTKLFPNLKPKQSNEVVEKVAVKSDSCSGPVGVNENPALSSLLKEKLAQLENEIEKFRLKNLELTKMKEKQEQDLKSLENSMVLFEKQKQAEMVKFNEYKEEEIRKLKHERKLFDMYQKTHKDAPDRRERDEIEKLKKQVSDLQEELKTKEVRWTANNSRMKDRIDGLEKERDDLKKELMLIEKQRLEAMISVAKDEPKSGAKLVTSRSQSSLLMTANQAAPKLQSQISEPARFNNYMHAVNGKSSANEPPELQVPPIMSMYTNALSSMSQNKSQNDSYETLSNKSASHLSANTSKSVKFKLDSKESSAPSPVDSKLVQSTQQKVVQSQISPQQLILSFITGRQIKIRDVQRFDDGRTEKTLEDGSVLTEFMNGTIKEESADKRHVLVKFFNGDRKEMNQDAGSETYYYAQTNVTQITYGDGLQVLKFPNGQIEKHYPNDTKEIIFPDKIVKIIYTDGSEESRYTNGTVHKVDANGDKLIEYTNGQREIHTKDFKRREYPDGSVKTVYANGISETRYANGRIRVKDEFGNIITDKKE